MDDLALLQSAVIFYKDKLKSDPDCPICLGELKDVRAAIKALKAERKESG